MSMTPIVAKMLVQAFGPKGLGKKKTAEALRDGFQAMGQAAESGAIDKLTTFFSEVSDPAKQVFLAEFRAATSETRIEIMKGLLEMVNDPSMDEVIENAKTLIETLVTPENVKNIVDVGNAVVEIAVPLGDIAVSLTDISHTVTEDGVLVTGLGWVADFFKGWAEVFTHDYSEGFQRVKDDVEEFFEWIDSIGGGQEERQSRRQERRDNWNNYWDNWEGFELNPGFGGS